MNLKVYDASSQQRFTGRPFITIDSRGKFRFLMEAVRRIKPRKHEAFIFHQDVDKPEMWFIQIVNRDHPQCYPNISKDLKFYEFGSRSLSRALRKSYGLPITTGTIRVMIGSEPIKHDGMTLWPLISKTATLLS